MITETSLFVVLQIHDFIVQKRGSFYLQFRQKTAMILNHGLHQICSINW